jgi:hypothetical protein
LIAGLVLFSALCSVLFTVDAFGPSPEASYAKNGLVTSRSAFTTEVEAWSTGRSAAAGRSPRTITVLLEKVTAQGYQDFVKNWLGY